MAKESPAPASPIVRRYRAGKDGTYVASLEGDAAPSGDDRSTWIVQADDRPVGVCTWQWTGDLEAGEATIVRLWVEPDYRRRGLGTMVYRRAVSEIRKQFRKAGVRLQTLTMPLEPEGRQFARAMKFDLEDNRAVRTFTS